MERNSGAGILPSLRVFKYFYVIWYDTFSLLSAGTVR